MYLFYSILVHYICLYDTRICILNIFDYFLRQSLSHLNHNNVKNIRFRLNRSICIEINVIQKLLKDFRLDSVPRKLLQPSNDPYSYGKSIKSVYIHNSFLEMPKLIMGNRPLQLARASS